MEEYSLAQVSVLGSMLIDNKCVGPVMAELAPDEFDEGISRDTFVAIQALFRAGEEVDPVTVLDKLGPSREKRAYILQLMDLTPTAANVPAYIDIVKSQSRLSRLKRLGAELAGCSTTDDAEALVVSIDAMRAGNNKVCCVDMAVAGNEFLDSLGQKREYLSWGIDFLDQGLRAKAGRFIILGGRPSDGKTALALSFAYHQAKTKRVGFFSLETDHQTLYERLMSSVSRVSYCRIQEGGATEYEIDSFALAATSIEKRNLFFVEASSMTVDRIRSWAQTMKFDVIYIDYLQIVRPDGQRRRYDAVTQISMDLHALAQECQTTVVALSQLSRADNGDGKKDGDKEKKKTRRRPSMSDLRESGQIEMDADIIMMLTRDDQHDNRSPRNLYIVKNKEGLLGDVPLRFNGDTQSFTEDWARLVPSTEPADSPSPKEPQYKQVNFTELPEGWESPF